MSAEELASLREEFETLKLALAKKVQEAKTKTAENIEAVEGELKKLLKQAKNESE